MIKKYSRQREAIISYLSGTDTHPTADEVYSQVRIRYPNVSLATVYRNLNQLCEDGEVKRLSIPGSPDHFDFRTEEHFHFCCSRCHRVYDVFADKDSFRLPEDRLPGISEGLDVMYYGICRSCSGDSSHESG